ncbi:MAG TPA: Sec-independent protein translocase protein TatB [Methylophilaceae bacterium]|nr:Sec-independent protein translocase protein TatB [Methylophilaceae bacterium]
MFDISFSELMIIAVVTLLVVGPDKLPQLARTVGAFVGRLQRYVAQVKDEVNREVRFEELQNLQLEIKEGKRKVEASMMGGLDHIHATASSAKASLSSTLDSIESTTKSNTRSAVAKQKIVTGKKSVKAATATKKRITRNSPVKKEAGDK